LDGGKERESERERRKRRDDESISSQKTTGKKTAIDLSTSLPLSLTLLLPSLPPLPPPPPPKNDKQICRFVPWAVKNYRLEDMTTPAELRRNVAALFKARPPIADPRVVDVLIYKGREELESIVLQHKQRHHLVGEYVLGPRAMRKASRVAAEGVAGGRSAFLDAFLKNTA
jgi:hypothetical protein